MTNMTAFCGLNCSQCPQYIATQNDDDTARAEASKMIREAYGLDIKPKEINCDGCHTENGRLLGYCDSCKVRACGMEKGVENCAYCKDQCDTLRQFHTFSPTAKTAFEQLLKKL